MSAPLLPCLLVTFFVLPTWSRAPGDPPSPPPGDRPLNQLTEQEKADGWRLLFDGVSTDGWRGVNAASFPTSGWEVRNGALVANAEGEGTGAGDIVTRDRFGEFDLAFEWRLDTRGGNSGVKYYVREREGETGNHGIGLEYQLLDDAHHEWMLRGRMAPNDYHTLGALYELYAPSPDKAPRPLGEWNQSRIVSRGGAVQHWLNGIIILEYDRTSPDFLDRVARSKFKDISGFGRYETGHILLQGHGSTVRFRNLRIRDLSNAE